MTGWTSIGPAPLLDIYSPVVRDAGEVVSIAVDPRGSTDDVIYAGTGHGGVWKTTDAGSSWHPLTDQMPSLSTGAVILDAGDPDTVYVGTGNPMESNGGSSFHGYGIYKSTDAGQHWTRLGASLFGPSAGTPGALIYGMLSLDGSPNVLLVATDRGLFRSVDRGAHFGSNAPSFNNSSPVVAGEVTGVVADTAPSAGHTASVYAVGTGTGILRSTDRGATFHENLFLNRDGFGRPGAPAIGTFGFLSMCVAPDGQTFYASVAMPSESGYLGLFRSRDRGATWSMCRAVGLDDRRQLRYDQTVGVDPRDSRRVYVGFVGLSISLDGGDTFTVVSGGGVVHADHHCVAFSPPTHWAASPITRAYVGTDGGIYTTTEPSGAWMSLNSNLACNLVTDLGIGSNDTRYSYVGLWDHGFVARTPAEAGASWLRGSFGDGGCVAVNPFDAQICYQAGGPGFNVTTDGGHSWNGVPGLPGIPNRLFFAPSEAAGTPAGSLSSSASLFAAIGAQIYQVGAAPSPVGTFPSPVFGTAASRRSPYAVWVSLFDGTVWRTDDIRMPAASPAPSWVEVSPPGPGFACAVAVHPRAANIACVVYQGYTTIAASHPTRHVYLTTDSGGSWTDVSGARGATMTNLPDLPVWAAAFVDESTVPAAGALPRIIVANEVAVMTTTSSTIAAPRWAVLGAGLPNVQCVRMQVKTERSQALVRVSTWGRGVFEWGTLPSAQHNWRWCHKCQGLFFAGVFAGVAAVGRCPAGGGHDGSRSGDYSLMNNAPDDPGQHGWRWCQQCAGLFFSGDGTWGRCPDGGPHDPAHSGDYSLMGAPGSPGQNQWRWCRNCQGMFFIGNRSDGACPAGGAHDPTRSGDYVLLGL